MLKTPCHGLEELTEEEEETELRQIPSDQSSNFIVVTLVMKEGGGDPIPAE